MSALDLVHAVGVAGLIDIALMAALVYTSLSWTRKTRASSALTGIVILGLLYLLARQFGLVLTATVFERFFAVILIALIVIFQGELRTVFEQIAALGSRRLSRRGAPQDGPARLCALLARTAFEMASTRVGALIVLQGQQPIDAHTSEGTPLDGRISGHLLKSIFDHHSPGHDGALVIQGDRVSRFAVHLPLSSNVEARGEGGTRHAAALGISEQTDAICILVSEERGTVALARHGELRVQESEARLFDALDEYLHGVLPAPQSRPLWQGLLMRNWRAKLAAIAIATAMWIVLVHGGSPTYRTYPVRVVLLDGSTSGTAGTVSPSEVRVTLRGPLRTFWMMRPSALVVQLQASEVSETQEVRVTPGALIRPSELAVEQIEPRVVRISPGSTPVPVQP